MIQIGSDSRPLGHTCVPLHGPGALASLLDKIATRRATHATLMNEKTESGGGSSRSHCAIILQLTQIQRATNAMCTTLFHLVDLSGSERPEKTREMRKSGMDAYYELQRMATTGEPMSIGAQGFIINMELSGIATAVSVSKDQHRKRKGYEPPKQCATAVMRYFGSCFKGTTKLSTVICLSQGRRNGWETWFSLQWGKDMAKLWVPLDRRKPKNLTKEVARARQRLRQAEETLNKAPKDPKSPAFKYLWPKKVMVRDARCATAT